eukprot:GEMP01082556.1.p1 GENE.GEMP01082556.1~~GEMP01082556.1.p1  ORF type:complete len:139 (+),score=16.71 GEMP01082556.1:141-557(+)
MERKQMDRRRSASTGHRIPLCFRTHRAMSTFSQTSPQLFEDHNVRSRGPRNLTVNDHLVMFYPLSCRAKWINTLQYKKRQLAPRKSLLEPTASTYTVSPHTLPVAGSRVSTGKFPRSFDYSGGMVLQDPFFDPKGAIA